MPRRTASSPSGELPEVMATEVAQRPEYRVEALAKGLRILSLFDEKRPVLAGQRPRRRRPGCRCRPSTAR